MKLNRDRKIGMTMRRISLKTSFPIDSLKSMHRVHSQLSIMFVYLLQTQIFTLGDNDGRGTLLFEKSCI